jgi:hypothetical protein
MVQLKRYFSAMFLPFVFSWVGCHNPDNFVLNSDESPSIDRFLSLSAVEDTTLLADGFSAVELVAQVHDVSEGPQSILFTTTAGSLRVGTRVGTVVQIDSVRSIVVVDSVVVQTNASGEARIELVSEPRQTTARVRASIVDTEPAVGQEIRIHFKGVMDEDLLVFVDPPDSAFAHGLALVPFTVRIAPGLEGEDRQVHFETTGGGFPFGADTSQVQIVRADAEGLATTYLRTPEQVGEALVRASVMTFSQEHVVRFVPAPADSVLRFVEAPEVAPADGQSLSQFSVRISPLLQLDEDRTVIFLTTLGNFVLPDDDGSTVSVRADADGVATAYLRSPNQFDEAFVRASVKGFVQQQVLQFDWVGPDSIIVRPDLNRLSIATGEQMKIEAELIRLAGRGQVTENLEVIFAVTDSLGNALQGARFVDVTRTDAQGLASAVFAVDDTLYQGSASISVRPARVDSEVVGRAQVTILRP